MRRTIAVAMVIAVLSGCMGLNEGMGHAGGGHGSSQQH